MTIDFETVVPKIDAFLGRGLSVGVGNRDGQMCVEAAICAALDLPHGDDPGCVHSVLRQFKIKLNDSAWSSPRARANGLRSLAIAQLGTKDTLDGPRFVRDVVIGIVNQIIAELPKIPDSCREQCRAAKTIEAAGSAARATRSAADAAAYAAAGSAARATRSAADAYAEDAAARAADAAAYAADADAAYAAAAYAAAGDAVLLKAADIALAALRNQGVEKVPGLAFL